MLNRLKCLIFGHLPKFFPSLKLDSDGLLYHWGICERCLVVQAKFFMEREAFMATKTKEKMKVA